MIGSENNGMYMPVAPAYGSGCNNGFGDEWSSWILLFLIFGLFGNGGWGNGFGGNNQLGYDFPWLLNSNNRTVDTVTNGFDNAALVGQLNGIQSSITNGFSNAEVAGCNRAMNQMQTDYQNQIASMNQRFADTTAITAQMNNLAAGLQNCCCQNSAGLADLKYTVATENCTDRQSISDGIRDIIATQTASTQKILDQLCQDKIDAKNDEIARLRQEVAMKDLAASQTAQNAFIQAGFSNEVDQLYNRLNSCPVPCTPVYGKTPIFTCNGNYAGCGCGA